MRVVLFFAGNEARGDDALGALLGARAQTLSYPALTVHQEFQFQIEHALDLPEDGLVLFVDAHATQEVPLRLQALLPARDCAVCSHALAPAEVLAVAQRIGRALPPAWVLSLRARSFGLGEGLSPSGQLVLAAGWGLLRALLARPSAAYWATLATNPRA